MWTEHRETEPWESVDEILDNYRSLAQKFRKLTGKRGRPPIISETERKQIIDMLESEVPLKEITKRFPHLSRWVVYRVVRKIVVWGIPIIEIRTNKDVELNPVAILGLAIRNRQERVSSRSL